MINLIRLFALSILFGIPAAIISIFPSNSGKLRLRSLLVKQFLFASGPSFIKLGQILATRPDLVGKELSCALCDFQDKLPQNDAKKIKSILCKEFGLQIEKTFLEFDFTAIASASMAQVHKARLLNGEMVAVKILHPNIRRLMNRDIRSLKILASIIGLFSKFYKKFFNEVSDLLTWSAKYELDLLNEAANASQARDYCCNLEGFYVPKIFWNFSSQNILVMEWIEGIPFSRPDLLTKSRFDLDKIALNLVKAYLHQVYNCGFFHADMHQGNLFLMNDGRIAVVDFGIMGKVDQKVRIAIAQILIGFLQRDYMKVAEIHVREGLVPRDANLIELSLACRRIGETFVGLDVKDISIAKVIESLIKMTREYKMNADPNLLLLQKTLFLLEGVGSMLNPNLNIWYISRPWMEDWAKKNISFDARILSATKDVLKHCWKIFRSEN